MHTILNPENPWIVDEIKATVVLKKCELLECIFKTLDLFLYEILK